MARIKPKDLPKDRNVSKDDMENIKGGMFGGIDTFAANAIKSVVKTVGETIAAQTTTTTTSK